MILEYDKLRDNGREFINTLRIDLDDVVGKFK